MAVLAGEGWGGLGDGGSVGVEPTVEGGGGGDAGGSSGVSGAAVAAGRALAVLLPTPRLVVVRREEGCRGVGVAMEAESDGRDQLGGNSEGRA
jgi:hypothetical protein